MINIYIKGDSEGEKKEKVAKRLFEKTMVIQFLNLPKDMSLQIQKAQLIPRGINPKRLTPRHIIIKLLKDKDKERIFKAVRKKQLITYKGFSMRT